MDTLVRFGRIAALGAILALGACGEEEAEETTEPTAEPDVAPDEVTSAPEEPAEATPAPAPPGTPPPPAAGSAQVDGACSRVAACCQAFHIANHVPSTPCDGFATMPDHPDAHQDPRCVPTLDGYRRSFEQMGLEIPEACR
ncbi:MAG: hypothetical protein KC619_34800 [Myxococcales bacterium]|nr:hypothetical protein [Myxococcales bacterium]